MTDFPILIEKKIEEVMKEEVSSGYKKLLCQEFGFLIECLNQFNEN